jgi:hypothetical protein
MLSGEAINTNFIVFSLTRPGLKPTIYRTKERKKEKEKNNNNNNNNKKRSKNNKSPNVVWETY